MSLYEQETVFEWPFKKTRVSYEEERYSDTAILSFQTTVTGKEGEDRSSFDVKPCDR